MPRVVAQPFRLSAFAFRRKRDRAADLQHHFRHRRAQAIEHLVEDADALGALAIRFAAMDVQHGCSGVVAIDRLLHLVGEGDRNVFREIARQPLRTVGRHLNHELLLVFG